MGFVQLELLVELDLSLKALANSSPGLRFWQPWDHDRLLKEDATLKGLRRRLGSRQRRNPFRVAKIYGPRQCPRVSKQNPGLKLANAFSVKLKLHQHNWTPASN